MIRTVYLAGGINGLSDADATDWREEMKRLLPRAIGVLDPMSRDYRGREAENVAEIVKGDLEDIASCQAMIAYCPRPSWGTAMEIYHAARVAPRRVIAIVPEGLPISPWLRHHTEVVVATLEEAVDALLREPNG